MSVRMHGGERPVSTEHGLLWAGGCRRPGWDWDWAIEMGERRPDWDWGCRLGLGSDDGPLTMGTCTHPR